MKKPLIFTLIVFSYLSLFSQQKGVTLFSAQNTSPATGSTYAVVVGISNYRSTDFPDLKYARRDAETFTAFLQSKSGGEVPKDNIRLLTDAYATGARLNAALDWLAERAMVADKVIIYLAGYGDTQVTKTATPEHFFLSDSPIAPLRAGTFKMSDIALFLNSIRIGNQPDFFLVCNFYPLALPGNDDSNVKQDSKKSALFSNAFSLNTTEAKDYIPKTEEEKTALPQPGIGTITNNHLLLDGLLGLADRNNDMEIRFRELKKFLRKAEPNAARKSGLLYLAVGRKYDALVRVDLPTLEKLKFHDDNLFSSIIHLETGEKEDRILKGVSEDIQLAYRDFVVALKLGHLLAPEGQSASFFYEKLKQEPSLKQLHGDMRRRLGAAMQDEVQQALNAYLKLDNAELERRRKIIEPYRLYARYLSYSIELFGRRSFMIKILEAKKHYFEGLVARMEFIQDNRKELLDQAIERQEAALALAPDASFIYNELGVIYFLKEDWRSAEHYFKTAVEFSPTWSIPYANLCNVFGRMGDFEAAIAFGIKGYKRTPKNVFVSNALASAYLQANEMYGAERIFQIVLQQDPKNNFAHYNMACIQALSGNKEEALIHLGEALRNGYTDMAHLSNDQDLISLKEEPEYKRLVAKYSGSKE